MRVLDPRATKRTSRSTASRRGPLARSTNTRFPARLNVTRAVCTVVLKIQAECPGLGRHLDRSAQTGPFCSYEPGGDVALGDAARREMTSAVVARDVPFGGAVLGPRRISPKTSLFAKPRQVFSFVTHGGRAAAAEPARYAQRIDLFGNPTAVFAASVGEMSFVQPVSEIRYRRLTGD